MTEIIKYYTAQGHRAPIYFWRDHIGNEIDLIIDHAGTLTAIEIKPSQTFILDLLRDLSKWEKFINLKEVKL
ncbi:MAG: hypothetical protein A3E87_09985 [Gammaproteobacteria bacterium RIFCSPHIGHO2_12_FULL_35_23]|nr:MAG: hypothetical protein A3E87_09985 [Gammaproteobacteria bacterium RIFCSPHIGHO2_12_FULL_35_23]